MVDGRNSLEVARPVTFQPKVITAEERLTLEKLWRRIQKSATQPKFYAEIECASLVQESEKAVLITGFFPSEKGGVRGGIWSPKSQMVTLPRGKPADGRQLTVLMSFSFFRSSLGYAASKPELSEMSHIYKSDLRGMFDWALDRYYERLRTRDLTKSLTLVKDPFPEPDWAKLSVGELQPDLF